jgi:hypothetical protein
MIQPKEIVMLIIGIGVFVFMMGNRSQLERIPYSPLLLKGFYVLFSGWAFTVIEGFFWGTLFNYLEHVSYAAASLLIAAWCWKVFGRETEAGQ